MDRAKIRHLTAFNGHLVCRRGKPPQNLGKRRKPG